MKKVIDVLKTIRLPKFTILLIMFIILALQFTFAEFDISSVGLVAHYPTTNSTYINITQTADVSSHQLNATVVGAVFNNTDSSYAFDGNDYLTHSSIYNTLYNGTVGMWIQPATNLYDATTQDLWSTGNAGDGGSIEFKYDGQSDRIGFDFWQGWSSNSGYAVTPNIAANKPHCLIFTWGGVYNGPSNMKIMLDGELLSVTDANMKQNAKQAVSIGGNSWNDGFVGRISNIIEYNSTKSTNEMKQFCDLGKLGNFDEVNISINYSKVNHVINENFIGVNTHGIFGSNISFINPSQNVSSDYMWHRNMINAIGMNYLRADMNLEQISSGPGTWNAINSNSQSINQAKNYVQWAKQDHKKILFVSSYMPGWLNDTTQGCSGAPKTCPPKNYTQWGNLVVDFLNTVNCTVEVCEVEVWNEPNLNLFWMSNTSYNNATRITNYLKLYNATYEAVKASYPNMKVGGPALTAATDSTQDAPFYRALIGNFSTKLDFLSVHAYNRNSNFPTTNLDEVADREISAILSYCVEKNVICPRIVVSEHSVMNSSIMINQTEIFASQNALALAYAINYSKTNISFIHYEWSSYIKYGVGYSQYPLRYDMVSEPALDNANYSTYYLFRDVISAFSPEAEVVSVINNNPNLWAVASNNNGSKYYMLVNRASIPINISLYFIGVSGGYWKLVNNDTNFSSNLLLQPNEYKIVEYFIPLPVNPPFVPTGSESSDFCSEIDLALLAIVPIVCMIAIILALFNMNDPLKTITGLTIAAILIPFIISVIGAC